MIEKIDYGIHPCIKCGKKKALRFKANPCHECKREARRPK